MAANTTLNSSLPDIRPNPTESAPSAHQSALLTRKDQSDRVIPRFRAASELGFLAQQPMELGEGAPDQQQSMLELPIFSQDYEVLLQDKENADHSLNKLRVKRELISEAVAKNKPKKERSFVNPVVEMANVRSIAELPGNLPMKITQMIAKRLLWRKAGDTTVTA